MARCGAPAAPETERLSARARRSARLVRIGTTRPSASMSAVAASRSRLNSSAETTRTSRPWASRIVTGAIDSSPEGSRTAVQEGFMGYASYRESEPLTPSPGCRTRDTGRRRARSTRRNRGTALRRLSGSCSALAVPRQLIAFMPLRRRSRTIGYAWRIRRRPARAAIAEVVDMSIDRPWLISDQRTQVDDRLRQLLPGTRTTGARARFVTLCSSEGSGHNLSTAGAGRRASKD